MKPLRQLSFKESASLNLTRKAELLKSQGKAVYNFGIGEPDFTTPERIIEYAFNEAKSGKTHYTPSQGIMELRKAISEKLEFRNKIHSSPDNIIVTPTKFAIYSSILSVALPGEDVMIPDPYYLSYPDIVKLADANPVSVATDENFEIDLSDAEEKITPKTKMFILNSPANPTGKVYSRNSIKKLCDFVLDHDLFLLSDEIYEDLIFDGEHFSPASIEEMADRTITVSGFSKSYAMTGWRIGYLQANKEIVSSCNRIQQQSITCAPSVSQYAALEALKDRSDVEKFRKEFAERREIVIDLLGKIDGLNTRKPEGTFYVFPQYASDEDSERFCSDLLTEKGVIVTPGSAFGNRGERHFRLSFATSESTIREGIAKLSEFIEEKKP